MHTGGLIYNKDGSVQLPKSRFDAACQDHVEGRHSKQPTTTQGVTCEYPDVASQVTAKYIDPSVFK